MHLVAAGLSRPYKITRARRQGLETCPRAAHRLPDREPASADYRCAGTMLTGNVSVPREPV